MNFKGKPQSRLEMAEMELKRLQALDLIEKYKNDSEIVRKLSPFLKEGDIDVLESE